MRVDDLRFFTRVAALGSLSAAGKEIGLSPSASSARLTSLEKAVGAQLVFRTTRSAALTEAGQVLLESTTAALSTLDAGLAALEAGRDAPRGLLKISCNVFFGHKHVLPFLNEFMELYPDIRFELSFSDRIVDIVEEGYDLAFRGAPLPDSSLKARRLGANQRVLCASPDYLARKGVPKTPADLANHDCIGISQIPVWYFEGPNGEIAQQVTPYIAGDSGGYSSDAALQGLGIAVKSGAHIWEELRDGRLIAILPEYPVARTGAVWAVSPPGNFTPPKTRVLIDFLLNKYGRPAYWEFDLDKLYADHAEILRQKGILM
ncbi:LysR family transcriptional regulator [Roseibium sp. RKSG952]|uniref:LysR family transcriptional regulator n=1 Tax=Roseibium sp. RKSG952 TaxID=2529384 RepID=UPI0012BCBE2A|nr:LysR family transcriptional regulator [Roseibium sp. RKSG952]MTI00353.1 LysR family transcriptional regulator [Roseibium sp. RKSG952]